MLKRCVSVQHSYSPNLTNCNMHSKMDPSLKLKICVGKIIHLARNNTVQLVCIDNINSVQLRLLEESVHEQALVLSLDLH